MTTKITYLHKFCDDCNSVTDWNKQGSPTLTATLSVVDDDFFDINATGGTGSVYWYRDFPNFLSNDYPNYVVRVKTSNATVKAKVVLQFTAGTQDIVPEDSYLNWTVKSGTITPSRTVDFIQIYATSGIGHVYFDFILLSRMFPFPHVAKQTGGGGINLKFPEQDITTPLINRLGSVTEYVGSESPEITLSGDVLSGESWGSPVLEALYYVYVNARSEPFQWFETETIKCKVRMADLQIDMEPDSNATRVWMATLRKYDRSSGSSTYNSLLEWLGL